MRLTNEQLAHEIIKNMGGVSNIINNTTCMTRLHLRYRNSKKINLVGLKNLDAVFGVVEGETIQIVFGPGKVTNVGNEISKITAIPIQEESKVIVNEEKSPTKSSKLKLVQIFFKHFANIFLPILPGIAGAGMINGITKAINVYTDNAYIDIWWYALIMTMGWALFAYLPIFVGMNAAKEFKGTPILGGIGGALSVISAEMPLLNIIDNSPIIIPLINTSYDYASGGIFAAVLTGILFAYIERSVRPLVPETIDMFVTPLITLIFGGIVSVVLFQYVGSTLTDILYVTSDILFNKLGVIGGFILATIQLPLVSMGLHRAFVPLHVILSDPAGQTLGVNYLLPILMVAGGGQVGAAIALYVRTNNKKLKNAIMTTLPAGILGVGEPLMYAITLPLLRPFIMACIGSGFGGIVIVLLNVGAISQGVSGIMAPLIMASGSRLTYLVGLLTAYFFGFLFTYIWGYKEEDIEGIFTEGVD